MTWKEQFLKADHRMVLLISLHLSQIIKTKTCMGIRWLCIFTTALSVSAIQEERKHQHALRKLNAGKTWSRIFCWVQSRCLCEYVKSVHRLEENSAPFILPFFNVGCLSPTTDWNIKPESRMHASYTDVKWSYSWFTPLLVRWESGPLCLCIKVLAACLFI